MSKYKVIADNKEYTRAVGGIHFVNGVAETDNEHIARWLEGRGGFVVEVTPQKPTEEPAEQEEITDKEPERQRTEDKEPDFVTIEEKESESETEEKTAKKPAEKKR